jgi:hypothetical protein
MVLETMLRPARSRRGAGAPVWRLFRLSLPSETERFCAADLGDLAVLLGRRCRRPQNHAIGLRPHMSPPDANEGSNCNDNKRQRYCILHSKFSLCDLGSLGPSWIGEDQKEYVGLHPSSPPHTTCNIGEENPPHHPTFDFSANVRGTSVTLLCYPRTLFNPRRAEAPGLELFSSTQFERCYSAYFWELRE